MKQLIALILTIVIAIPIYSQKNKKKDRVKEAGQVQLGMRSTISLFGDEGNPGIGYGGQFRIRAGKRLNTEWYADYIKTNIKDLGDRQTAHIGWSVMFYPLNTEVRKGTFTPYLIAGNCFDYSKITSHPYAENGKYVNQKWDNRYSTAVQAGIGGSYNISDNFDLTLTVQYMQHIGDGLHSEIKGDHLELIDGSSEISLEGHLLITLSLNVIAFDFLK